MKKKIVTSGFIRTTYYVRDATGNIQAVYEATTITDISCPGAGKAVKGTPLAKDGQKTARAKGPPDVTAPSAVQQNPGGSGVPVLEDSSHGTTTLTLIEQPIYAAWGCASQHWI